MGDPDYYNDLALSNGISNAVARLNKRIAEAIEAGLTVRMGVGAPGDGGDRRARSGCEIRVVKVRREKAKP